MSKGWRLATGVGMLRFDMAECMGWGRVEKVKYLETSVAFMEIWLGKGWYEIPCTRCSNLT